MIDPTHDRAQDDPLCPADAAHLRRAFADGTCVFLAHPGVYLLQSLAFVLILLAVAFLADAPRSPLLPRSFDLSAQVVNAVLGMLLSIGLYRSLWDGLRAAPVRFGTLFWGFFRPHAWGLTFLSALVLVPLSMITAFLSLTGSPETKTAMFFAASGINLLILYTAMLLARLDVSPRVCLRRVFALFTRGRRRLLVLPLLIALVLTGAIALLYVAFFVLALAGRLDHLPPRDAHTLALLVMFPATLLFLFAAFPWSAAVLMAGSRALRGCGFQLKGL